MKQLFGCQLFEDFFLGLVVASLDGLDAISSGKGDWCGNGLEKSWDYAAFDVWGKFVLMTISEPGFAVAVKEVFLGFGRHWCGWI